MGTMEEELAEMEKALETPDAGKDDLHTDPPGTKTPGTTAPGTKAPGTSAPGTKAPATKSPATTAPHTEAPIEDPRDKKLRELEEKLAKLEEKKTPPPTKAPSTKAPQTEPPLSDEDFLSGVDLDELTRDPKLFNELLNKVRKNALAIARAEAKKNSEFVVRSIPDIVKNNVALTARLKKLHDQFYDEHKDLVPWKKSVGTVMEEMISEHPDKTYEQLLPEVATEVRKRLGLHKDANRGTGNNPPPPPPRKKGGQRQQSKPDTSDLAKEMDEMDKALGLD